MSPSTQARVLALFLLLFLAPAARADEPLAPRTARPTELLAKANGKKSGLSAKAPSVKPAEKEKQWVWLEKQGVWGFGYQIASGPNKGLWRIDPDSKQAPEPAEPEGDPYLFTAMLNNLRASAGLGPVAHDPDLSNWAAHNNAAQCRRGLGHHVNPNCFQNSAWNTPDASSTVNTWLTSPGHRENMFSPEITRVGIAYGPGPYWTMNAQ